MKPTLRVELELRHLPRFRVMDYLSQAGGQPSGLLEVQGRGWSAYVESLEPDQVGLVTIERDRLVIIGEKTEVERVSAFMQVQIRRMRRRR